MNSTTIPTAQLWLGCASALGDRTTTYIQQRLSPCNACTTCTTCRAIAGNQHHALVRITPYKGYTLDTLEPVFSTIRFARAPHDLFFFVLEHSELLTVSCSNALLKLLEEPPAGYHFILLAQNPQQLLPTIVSRCVIYDYRTRHVSLSSSPLFDCFTTSFIADPSAFSKMIDTIKITEPETGALIDLLVNYWMHAYTTARDGSADVVTQLCAHRVTALQHYITHPPMPGSSRVVWKDLYLSWFLQHAA